MHNKYIISTFLSVNVPYLEDIEYAQLKMSW